jgi:hypothetical protein
LSDLLDIIEMHEDTGETYDHSAAGFVFSEPQISAAKRARNRERLAAEAYGHRSDSAAA